MRSILYFNKNHFGKFSSLLLLSFYVSGCHTGNEPVPVPKARETEVKARQNVQKQTQSIPKHKSKIVSDYPSHSQDPFALPAVLQAGLHTFTQKPQQFAKTSNSQQNKQPTLQNTTMHQAVPLYSPEPCIAGIFDNGKDKFVLIRWQRVQGIFRKGEALGNGYYVKKITATSVILCSEQNISDIKPINITLSY